MPKSTSNVLELTEINNQLLEGAAAVTLENFHEGLPDAVLAEYTLVDTPNALDIPKEFADRVEKAGDDNPMYVTWAMPSGYSRYMMPESVGNDNDPSVPNRFWSEEVIYDFAEQIKSRGGVAGYGGHANVLTQDSIPENIPVYWIAAAKARRKSDNRAVALVRGYVTRQGNYRENITLGIIDSASVSTIGTTKRKTREDGADYEEVQKGAALLSFDLVRKDTHGIPGTRLVANLASEESSMEISTEIKKFLSELTREQLADFNPGLVESIRDEKPATDTTQYQSRIKELVTENIDLHTGNAIAERLAELCGVERTQLVETVNNLLSTQATLVEQAIDVAVGKIKNDKLKAQIKESVAKQNPATPTDAQQLVQSELAKVQGMIEMLANEHDFNSVLSTEQSGKTGNKVLASFLTEGDE